jgi:predicted HTH transcriptional regulator
MGIKDFFDLIDLEKIKEFVQDQQEEHLTLEFKTVSRADLTDKQDRRNFAKAISGFANSSGGTIVWGVEAKGNKQKIDCACGFKEIDQL